MRKLSALIVFAALLVGCGDKQEEAPAPSPAQAEATPDPDLEGYSEGVKKYYGEVHSSPRATRHADVEAEYHQPPKPAEAALGETITLTGTNIGIRQRVTVTAVDDLGEYTAVRLKLENTGITVYEAPLRNAALTFADGEPQPPAHGREGELQPQLRHRDACGSTSALPRAAACCSRAGSSPSASSSRSRSCPPTPAGSGTCVSGVLGPMWALRGRSSAGC